MTDTGFYISTEQRRRAALMYRLDPDGAQVEPVIITAMGPVPVREPAGGQGRRSTAVDRRRLLKFVRNAAGMRQSMESARAVGGVDHGDAHESMTDAQMQIPRFWAYRSGSARGFRAQPVVVTDPARSAQLFGPGGAGSFSWPGAFGTW